MAIPAAAAIVVELTTKPMSDCPPVSLPAVPPRPRAGRWPFSRLTQLLQATGHATVDMSHTFDRHEVPAAPPAPGNLPLAGPGEGGPGEPGRPQLMPWRFL